MRESIAYWNGQYLPYSQATLSLHDAGFVFGATVTDRFRTFRQKPYRLNDHLKRFQESCRLAHIPMQKSFSELLEIVQQILDRNKPMLTTHQELAVILFATPGPIGAFAGMTGSGPPTFGVYGFPVSFLKFRSYFESGVHVVPSTHVMPSFSIDSRIKHRSRLAWWIADREVHAEHGSHAVPLFVEGSEQWIRETWTANFLAVIDDKVVSPPRTNILNGMALQIVEEICRDLQIPFEEREMTVAEVQAKATECFLTNSTYCLASIDQFGEKKVTFTGLVYERILSSFSHRVGVEIRTQILS